MAEHEIALCATFHRAVELIGRRWTGAIIQVLLQGRMRYCDLRDAIPNVNERMLSERLRELESEGIVVRIVVPDTPVRVEYELTKKGRALEKSLTAVAEWASKWTPAAAPASNGPRVKVEKRARAR